MYEVTVRMQRDMHANIHPGDERSANTCSLPVQGQRPASEYGLRQATTRTKSPLNTDSVVPNPPKQREGGSFYLL